jgi:hypothetical protein
VIGQNAVRAQRITSELLQESKSFCHSERSEESATVVRTAGQNPSLRSG